MENNGRISHITENQSSGVYDNGNMGNGTEKDVFVNHAEIAWHERRREWVGDPSRKPKRVPQESIMSWTISYEDQLNLFPNRSRWLKW